MTGLSPAREGHVYCKGETAMRVITGSARGRRLKELEGMGRNGRRLVEERYSCQRIAREFMEIYKGVRVDD